MVYPNGSTSLNKLQRMVESEDFLVYYEPNDEPPDWDWKKNGIYHSPNRIEITDEATLVESIRMEFSGEGRICYTATDEYFKKHPYDGEEVCYIKEEFFWEYSSLNGKRYCYKICPCTYLKGYEPKHIPLCLECFENGFNGSCFTIGSWERDKEGYEFRSVGSRMWQYIDEEDLPIIYKAIAAADSYLNGRFASEED